MKGTNQIHWAIQEIAEQEAPKKSIDIWPRVEEQVSLPDVMATGAFVHSKGAQIALGLVIAVLLIASLLFVPAVRAFADDILQRMGIAFVDTQSYDENVRVEEADTIYLTPRPSISIAEIREQVDFVLMLPTWLPDGLTHIHRSISEYDSKSWEGSGKQVSIQYYRSADFDYTMGNLSFLANDGPLSAPPLLAESRGQAVTVNGQPGIYVHGGWQNDGSGDPNTRIGNLQWDDQADDAYLTWKQDGVTYLLAAHNLGLALDDLLRIAGSMKAE